MTLEELYCPICGPITSVDEDRCCGACGADTFSSGAPWFVSAIRAAVEEEREACVLRAYGEINRARDEGECDLRQVREWVTAAIRRKP